MSDTIAKPSLDKTGAQKMITETLKSQNIDVTNLPIHSTGFQDHDVRLDHQVEYEKDLIAENKFSITNIIKTGVSGNLFTEYSRYFKIPEDWKRNYLSYNALFIMMLWGSLALWVSSIIIGSI